jgi:hypothetical protein
MSTDIQINLVEGEDDYGKIITVRRTDFTIEDWAATLPESERLEWRRQHDIHEDAVHAAVAAGDAEINDIDPYNVVIKWKNPEIHEKWMNTISAEDNEKFHDFWRRYHIAAEKRMSKK